MRALISVNYRPCTVHSPVMARGPARTTGSLEQTQGASAGKGEFLFDIPNHNGFDLYSMCVQ